MIKNSSLNAVLLIFSAIAAAAVYGWGELLLRVMTYLPFFLQCGIYLLFVTALCFIAIFISEKINSGYYIPRGRVTFNSTCAKATAIFIPCAFALGLLTQLLYNVVMIRTDDMTPDFQGTMIVCDISGSMEENDPDKAAVDALIEYIESVPRGEYLGVIVYGAYSETVREYAPLESEKERDELIGAVENVWYDGASTETQDALLDAIKQMRRIDDANWPGLILLMSDGEAYLDYGRIQRASLGDRGNPRNIIPINTIFFGSAEGGDQMEQIAEDTGGTYFNIGVGVDNSDLREMFTRSRGLFSFEIEQPHLLLTYNGAARTSVVRIILHTVLLSLWGAFTGVAAAIFLNNNKLFTAFLIPRVIVSVVISAAFTIILAVADFDAGPAVRALLAVGTCLLYLPTYRWDTNVRYG